MKKIILPALLLFSSYLIINNAIIGNTTHFPPQEYNKTIEVLFCKTDDCTAKLIQLFNTSKSINCALYSLNIPELLTLAKQKNALIISDANKDFIQSNNIKGLMHNKFCIFDNEIVLTGSFNPTDNSKKAHNNIVTINSQFLILNYLEEFYEMIKGTFGSGKNVKYPFGYINGKKIENYFCPEDDCKTHVIEKLFSANKSIYFMTYSFTDDDIGNLLLNKADKGIEVKGLFDKSQISKYSEYHKLSHLSEIIPYLHHKVFIIDKKIVITGSYNPSKNGNENNDENILIIEDEEVAKKYLDEFKKIT